MKRVCISLAAALALVVPSLAQSAEETPFSCEVRTEYDQSGKSYSSLADAVAAVPTDGKIHYVSVIGEGPAKITTPITVKAGQNIESGTIVSVDANGGACIWNEADVTVKGGTFTTEVVGTPSDKFGPGCLNNSGTALVTGGTFHNVNRRTYAIISNKGSIEITPAEGSEVTVFGAHGGLGVDGGTAVVNGGTYSSSDYYGLYVSNDGLGADPMQAAVTVNDGTFDGKSYSVWVGSDYNDPVNSTIAIKGGTFLKPLHRQDVSRPDAIQVSGGTFSQKPDDALLDPDFVLVENQDGTFGVASAYVASIGDVEYDDFNSFFTAFQEIAASETPTTVTLLADLTGDRAVPGVVTVVAGQNIVFDLNIESGTIVSVDANGGACIWNEADVTVKGGTFTTEFVGTPSDEFGPGCLNNSGTALVTGGTFHNVNHRIYAIISNTGSIEITPAEGSEVKVFGAHGGLGVDGGTAVVNGGTYSSSDFYGLYVSNDGLGADPMQAAVTVNGGTFDGKSYSVWVGSDYNNPVNSTIAIKGGTFRKDLNRQSVSRHNALQVSGGTFAKPVDLSYCADGYIPEVNAETGTYGVTGGTYVAAIETAEGVAGYEALQAAFDAAKAGQTVTLIADVDCSEQGVKVAKSVTFDLNGRTLSLANANTGNLNIAAGATLTLMDSAEPEPDKDHPVTDGTGGGKIVATHDYADGYGYGIINVSDGATFVMESGLIDTVRETPVNNGQFGVMVAGTGKVTINGGHIRAGWYAIAGNGNDNVEPGTTIVVNGGILESTADYAIYHPQAGTLSIAGGTVAGAAGGLSINRGSATITGGTVTSQGTGDTGDWGDGTSGQGNAAITVGAEYGDVALAISGEAVITAPEDVPAISVPESDKAQDIAISGGTFSEKPDNAWFADGFIPVENEDGTFGVAEGSFAAEIDGVKYLTLKEAIAAVPANGAEATTITLLDDVTSAGSLTFTNGQKAILNMNGKTVTFTSGKLQLLTSASLTLTGEGSLVCEASGTGAISIYGNETSQIDLLVDSAVTVDGHYGIALFGNGAPACRNVTVTVKGTVKTSEGGSALYVNGTVNNTEGSVPQIILAEGAKVEAASIGIYAAGYAKWDLAGTINAGNDAISVKSGTFNITGGSYTANGPYVECPVANSNGTEHVGAAIGITTNGDYAKPIVVNITGGDFISTNGYALYEGIAKTSDGTPAAEASAAVIAITGGDFTGSKTNVAVTADISITTAENPRVISGGTFSKPIPEALCALGYVPVDTPNAEGKYTVEHPLFTKVGVQMADGSYKVYDSMYEACYDAEMIAQEGATGTIIVLEDIEFDSYFRVLAGQNVTFDLNGHTVTCTGGGFSYAIDWVCNDDITAKPTVTITDSSIGQTGVLRSDGPYLDGLVRMVGGKLNITGGRFVQDVDNPNAQYKDNITVLTEGLTVDPEPGRTVEFSGGTIRVESNAATSVQNFGTAIKGGLFHSSEGRPAIEVAHVTQGLVVSGGSFEGDGKAILISAPATITISGGDFTDDIVAIEKAGATVKLSGGVFENAVFTGPGTLDVNPAINDLSMASVDTSLGKLMLAGDLDIGTNRLPNTTVEISASATVSMDAVEKELEIGKVNVFSAGNQMEAPQNLTLTVGNLLATQTLVEPTISVENDTIVLTFLAVPTELVGSEAFLAYLRQEDLGSIVSVTGTTKGGTVALTATELNEALSVFRLTNDLFTLGDTDGGKTLVVDYDFGITDVRVQRDTGDLVVTVAVQNAQAQPLAFAEDVTFALRNGDTPLEATASTVADGVTTLTVPAAKLPTGVLKLSVSVAPAAEAETPAE